MRTLRVLGGRRAVILRGGVGKGQKHGRRLNTNHATNRSGKRRYTDKGEQWSSRMFSIFRDWNAGRYYWIVILLLMK